MSAAFYSAINFSATGTNMFQLRVYLLGQKINTITPQQRFIDFGTAISENSRL